MGERIRCTYVFYSRRQCSNTATVGSFCRTHAGLASALEAAARDVCRAIENEGLHPSYHRAVMSRHRQEWPTLWGAIDSLLDAMKATTNDGR